MKKNINISTVTLTLAFTVLTAQTHFTPITPTGLPYHIIIAELTIDGSPAPAGSEIGIFDDTLCVGTAILSSTGEQNIDIVAWEGNPTYDLTGFTAGDTIGVRVWVNVYDVWTELDVVPAILVGNGTFGYGVYSILSLAVITGVAPVNSVDPGSLNFGAIVVGSSSTLSFTIENIGNAVLQLQSVWSNNSQFSVGSYSGTIPPDSAEIIDITFNPSNAAQASGSITIQSNDPMNSVMQVALLGQGIPQANPVISVSPTSLDFGVVQIGETRQENLQIANPGSDTLQVTGISISPSSFDVSEEVFTIPSGEYYTIQVTYHPQYEGTETGNITIYSNAYNGNTFTVYLSGYGFMGHFTPVAPTGLPYTIIINSVDVDNHEVVIRDEVAAFDDTLCVGSTVYTGSYPFQLIVWEAVPTENLAGFTAGDSITMKLWATAYDSTLELIPDVTWVAGDGTFGAGEYSVTELSSVSRIEPVIRLEATDIEFSPTEVGYISYDTIYVYNDGGSNLTVTSISSSTGIFGANQSYFTISPQDSHLVSVYFSPSVAIPYTGVLSIHSNDPVSPVRTINFSGQGLAQPFRNLEVSTIPIQLNPTGMGDMSSVLLPLYNSGSATIHVSSVAFGSSTFLTAPTSFDISSSATINMPIYFSPGEVGFFQSTLTIYNDSQNLSAVSIDLSGIGYEAFFHTVGPTGLPYTIVVDSLIGPFDSTGVGDEIGIFDGSLCVGTVVVGEPNEPASSNISGIAWQEDVSNGLPGFQVGDLIRFRYFARRDGIPQVFDVDYTLVDGSGLFGDSPYTVVQADVSETSIHPERVQSLPDRTILEDSGPIIFPIDLNVYFSHPYDSLIFSGQSTDTSFLSVKPQLDTAIVLTPGLNHFGTIEAYISAFDEYYFAYDTFQVTILPVNDTPVLSGLPDTTFMEDDTIHFGLNPYVYDVDHDTTEITFTVDVINGTTGNLITSVDSVTHQVTFTAKPDSFGMFTVVITATDDSASSDTDTLAVNVTPINDSPFVYNPIPDTSFYVNSGTHVIVNNLYNVFKDIDTDLLVFSVDIVGDDISAEINGNSLSVTLEADSSGTNMVIVYTSDGELTVSDTFSVSFIRWAIQLTASLGNYFDRDNYLGVADGATNGLDTHFDEIEIPTLIDSNISLYFPHPEWNNQLGDNFSKDIRPEITLNDTLQIWDFEVVSTYAGEVTLTFVFKDFPDIPVMLKDSTTGIEQFLSNNAVYTFLALADSAYPFQVNVGDWTAPATISDLSVIETTSRSITIQWTAPGDDGNSGTAFEYDIRYLPSSISDDNFSSATRVTSGIPTPSLAGTADQLTIYGLNPFTTYYVAIKTMDDAGNVSSISNIDSVSTEGVPVLSPLAVWGKFHQDLQNSGNTAVDGAFLDSLLWRYQASDAINSSPTVDGSGSVYFGSEGGNVYALNADGSLKWSYNTGGGISAAPLVATLNRLYVGSKNGRFYAFNRETGEMEWTFLTGDQIVSSATVDGAGRIYVGSLDGKLYCLDSETGSLYWSVSIGTRIYSSPALSLDDSTVYIGGFDKKVYAVNTNTGQWRWFYTTGGYILGSAAVDTSGVIYIGSSDRKLYALNSDGSLKWSYTTGNSIWYSSPALGIDGNVYIGSDDKKLHAVRSSDGVLQWTYVTGGSIRNSPAVAGNGYVYVGSADNNVYAITTQGVLEWSRQLGGQVQLSSVAIGPNGNIYVGSTDNYFYSIGIVDTIPPAPPQNLEVVSGDKAVTLSWDENTESDFHHYIIYRSVISDFIPQSSDSLTSVPKTFTVHADMSVTNGLTYYYKLKAVDIAGNISQTSNQAIGTPTDLPPATPSNFMATSGDGYVTLSWSANTESDLARYILYHSQTSGFIPTADDSLVNVPAPDTTYIDSGLVNGQSYYYRLSAVDSLGNVSDTSNQVVGNPTDMTSPAVPQNLTVTNGDGCVTLSWSVNTESDLARYILYCSQTSGFIPTADDSLANVPAPDTTYIDSGLVNGQTYYYRLSAVDSVGNASDTSSQVVGHPVDMTPPAVPQNLIAFPGYQRVTINWNANNEADLHKYNIYRDLSSPAIALVDSVVASSPPDTFYIDSSLTNGITYYYRLTAVDTLFNESNFSDEVSATPADTVPPTAPQNLTAVVGNAQVTLIWNSFYLEDFLQYRIYGGTYSGPTTVVDSTSSLTDTEVTITGLINNTTYYYRVTAIDSALNESDFSNEVNVVPYGGPVWHVTTNGNNNNNGSESAPFATIQYSIDYSSNGDTVLVHPGTYVENINFNGKNIVVKSVSGSVSAIIDGNDNGTVVTFNNGENNTSELNGFTITNGNVSGISIGKNVSSSPLILNCIIKDNSGDWGGGIYCENSSAVFKNNLITNNEATYNGGGIYRDDDGSVDIINCTISGNSALSNGGGLSTASNDTVINCIIYDNAAPSSSNIHGSPNPAITYSNLQNGYSPEGEGNIDVEPLFVDADISDYYLSDYSPCIGAGTLTNAPSTDINGNPRPSPPGSNPDMGAYESSKPSQRPKSGIVNDGLSTDIDWWNSGNSISSNWVSFLDDSTITYEFALGNSPDSIANIFSWTTVGPDTVFTALGLTLSAGQTYHVNIRGTDIDNQVSDTTISDGFTVDLTNPVISYVYEGSATSDKDYQNKDTVLVLSWSGSDVGSGISYYEYALDTLSGDSGVVAWTPVGIDTVDTLLGISLHDGGTYYVSVRARDKAGNVSAIFTGDGITIDLTAPSLVVTVRDGLGEDIAYTGLDTVLSANWSGFSDGVSGIDEYAYAIGTLPNSNDIVPWTDVAADTSITRGGLTLSNGMTYYFSVQATDAAGYVSEVSSSDGVTVDTEVPIVGILLDGTGTDLDWTIDSTSLTASWGGFMDMLSGIGFYEYAIGTGSDSIAVVGWTPVDTATTVTKSDLHLSNNITYYFCIRATDQVGNISEVITSDGATVDLAVPIISYVYEGSLVSDKDYQNVADYLILSWSGSDVGSGISYYEYALDTLSGDSGVVTWTNVSTDTADTLAGVSLLEGATYYVSVRATDVAGNVSAKLTGDGIAIDLTAPVTGTVKDGTGEDIAYTGSDTSLSANWSGFSDGVSGIEEYEYTIGTTSGGTEVVDWASVLGDTSVTKGDLTLSNGETYYVSVRGTDRVGNTSTVVSSDGVIVDTGSPVAGVIIDGSVTDLDWINSVTTLSAAWSGFSDTLSGIEGYEYALGSSSGSSDVVDWTDVDTNRTVSRSDLTLSEGMTYYFSVRATDQVGNISQILTSDGITVDLTKPVLSYVCEGSLVSDKDYQNVADTLILSWLGSDVGSGISYYEYALDTLSGDSGFVAWTSVSTYTADTLAGVSLVEGATYYVSVRATDIAGNVSTKLTGDGITIDLTPPIVGNVNDGDADDIAFAGSDSSLSANWSGFSDAISGIEGYEFAIGTSTGGIDVTDWIWVGDTSSWSISSLSLNHGTQYFISVRASDIAGNVSDYSVSDGVIADVMVPSSEVVIESGFYNIAGWNIGNPIKGIASDANSGIAYVEISIRRTNDNHHWNGSSWVGSEQWLTAQGSENWNYSLSSSQLIDANNYEIISRAVDSVGNIETILSSDSFVFDITEPNTIFNIADEYYNPIGWESLAPIQGSANDDTSGIAQVEVRIQRNDVQQYWNGSEWSNDETWLSAQGTDEWQYTFLSAILSDGISYTINVRATDGAGNVETTYANDGFIFDLSPPFSTVLIDRDYYNNLNWIDASSISGTASDSISGLFTVEIAIQRSSNATWWDGTTWAAFQIWSTSIDLTNWTYSFGSTNWTNGVSYTVYSRATDVAGNIQVNWGEDTFNYDLTVPIIGQVFDGMPGEEIEWTNSTTTLSAYWTGFYDEVSGIDLYEYAIGTSSDGSDTGIWTEVGTDTMVTITNLNLQSGESYFISVKATDGAENTSPIATSDGVIVDAIPPVISSVIEGSLQEDQDYQQSSSDLILSWSGSDSWGISNYKISLGTTHGGTDIKDWIDVGIDSTHTFTGLTLEGGITYYGNVQAMDPAGNVSDIVTGDGIIVDQTGPIPGQVFDGDSTDVDWVSIDYFIKANWKGFSDVLSGIASYDYSVGLIPGETQIIDWYSVGLDSTLFTTAELIEGPTYYVNVRANDAVGNMGSLASSDGFGLDQTIPISGIVIDGLDVDLDWTANTTLLSASWSGFSDDKSGIAFYEYAIDTTSGGNELVDWTNNSDSTSFIKDDLSLVTGTTYYISVRAVDLVGNVSNGATSDGITVDNINPVVNIPNEGGIGEDYDFQNSLTELIISWTGSDAMRELMSYEYAIGTTPTGSDTVDWTDAGTQTNIIVTGLTLVEGITYYASVRALDMAGNVSGIATGDGITPDVTSPELGLVFDGFEAELTFTGTTDSLTARWTGFTDALSGISSYECAIGITAGDSDVVNWIPLGLDSSMVATDLSLTNGYRYYVSVRAIDSVGNRSGYVSSDGVIIDISPPILGLVIDGLSTDLDWTNNIDTLEASWSGFSDSLSGINFYEYALGTNSGESDVIYWQNNDTLRLVTGIGLNLMDGETYYFSVRATDNVRNVSAIVSSDGITVDTIPPVVSSVYEGSTELDLDYQSSDSTVILAWTGGDNASGIANYEYALGLSPGGIEILDWDSASTSLDTLIQSLVLDEGTTYFGSVRVYDVAGNLSTEVSGDGIMVDLTPPVPGSIIDGDSTDLVYTGSDSSLTATWVGFSDNLSGIQYYEYAIDTIPTGDDVYSWTDVGTDTTVTTSDLVLDDSVIYYQSIRAIDLVGNTSTIISSNGVTTDHSPPVTGIVFDGLDEDQTWTSSANTLSLSWTGFRDITCGIQFYEYAFDTTAGDDDLVPWTNVGLDTAVIKTGLTLENGITYYGSVRATDNVGNLSEPLSSNGITTDLFEPTVGVPTEGLRVDLDFQGSADTLAVFWSASDESQLAYYEFCVGTSVEDSNIVNWTNVGIDTFAVARDLDLIHSVAYFASLRAFDNAGNRSQVAVSDGITIDLYPPSLGTVIDGLTQDLDYTASPTSLSASWDGFSDTTSGIQFYEYAIGTTPGSTDVKTWTNVGTDLNMTANLLSLNHATDYYVSVRVTDNVQNMSDWVVSNGITTDHFGPEGYWALDGDSVDVDFSNNNTEFYGKWQSFTDSTSGLSHYQVALYDENDELYTVTWQANSLDTTVSFTGLELTEGHQYTIKVRGVDNVANNGAIISSDGVVIDMSAPAAPQNLVGYFSTNRIYLTWDKNQESDLATYNIYDTAGVILQTSTNEAEAFVAGFQDGNLYKLKLTATDLPGNESIFSNVVSGVPQEAQITHVIPIESHVLSATEKELALHFSQPLNDIGTVLCNSTTYPTLTYQTEYNPTDTSIVITINDPHASLDTIDITLSGILDWADNTTADKELQFTTYMLADYNDDFTIDVIDLNFFLDGWTNEDYTYELGPVTGSVPHLIPTPNTVYNLDDIMAFTRMWNWSHQQSTGYMLAASTFGEQPEVKQEGGQLIITMPTAAQVGQFVIQYSQAVSEMQFNNTESSDNRIFLKRAEPELGQLLVEYAYLKPNTAKQLVIDTKSLTRDNTNLILIYQLYSSGKQLVGSGTINFELIAIPDQFALHQNYPNPFNPITTINYDLPKNGNVSLIIYDILGRQVIQLTNEFQEAGYKSIMWNGRNASGQLVSAGMYFYAIEAGKYSAIRKMILLK